MDCAVRLRFYRRRAVCEPKITLMLVLSMIGRYNVAFQPSSLSSTFISLQKFRFATLSYLALEFLKNTAFRPQTNMQVKKMEQHIGVYTPTISRRRPAKFGHLYVSVYIRIQLPILNLCKRHTVYCYTDQTPVFINDTSKAIRRTRWCFACDKSEGVWKKQRPSRNLLWQCGNNCKSKEAKYKCDFHTEDCTQTISEVGNTHFLLTDLFALISKDKIFSIH